MSQRLACSPINCSHQLQLLQKKSSSRFSALQVNGGVTLVLYAVFEPLAVLCSVALWRQTNRNACYKLMWVVSLSSVLMLNFLGLFTGLLGWTGTVFCQRPTLIYLSGSTILGSISIILALIDDRC